MSHLPVDWEYPGRNRVAAYLRICTEYPCPVRFEIALVARCNPRVVNGPSSPRTRLGVRRKRVRDEHEAVLCDGDEAGVEGGVEVGCE